MAGRPGRRSRPFALVAAAGLAAVVAGSALAGPRPPIRERAAAPAALPAGSVETPGRNELVSTPQAPDGALGATQGATTEDLFGAPTLSADGRFVVFLQARTGGRANAVVVRDREAQTTTLLAASDANGPLRQPTISADGRWVAFVQPEDGPDTITIVEVATRSSSTLPQPPGRNRNPDQPALSRDGRLVAMRAQVSQGSEILVFDRASTTWETISVDVKGAPTGFSGARAAQPAISWDGRFVAFTAVATSARLTLTPRPTNDYRQVYLRDRQADTTTMLSLGPSGSQGGAPSLTPAISGDGSVVAFASGADDLVADDGNQQIDIFAWSATTGAVELVSRSSDGARANGPSGYPAVNGDGTQVAFVSAATTLVPGDTTAGVVPVAGPTLPPLTEGPPVLVVGPLLFFVGDVFVRDRGASRTARVSVGRDNASEPDDLSAWPSISASGRYVAFTSWADNLVADDGNKDSDVFVRDRPPRVEAAPDPVDFGSAPLGSLGTTRPATIRSTGISPARIGAISIGGANPSDFFVVANPCTNQLLVPGASCEIQVLFIGTAKGDRTAILDVANDAGDKVVLRLVGAVGIPKLTVAPASGPPGLVVIATGTGFPPNAPVTLTWTAGITAIPLVPVISDAVGGFTAQVLILPHDRIGKRNLRAVASVPGLVVDPVSVPFLVVTSTAGPPISGLVQVFAATPGEPIILRR